MAVAPTGAIDRGPIQTDLSPVQPMGLMRFKSNAQLVKEENLRKQSQQMLASTEEMDGLNGYINGLFRQAVDANYRATDNLLDALRRRKGIYSASHLAEIKRQGGSEIYMKITEYKCNACEAIISEFALPLEGRPWKANPTPKPDLPNDVVRGIVQQTMQEFLEIAGEVNDDEITRFAERLRDEAVNKIMKEAKKRAERMSVVIDDQLLEGLFLSALDAGISDVVTYGTMIIKGPYVEVVKTLEWVDEDDYAPNVLSMPRLGFKVVDPFKFFPSPAATTPMDATYLCEVDEFTRKALLGVMDTEGYSREAITAVLRDHKSGCTVPLRTNNEVRSLEDRTNRGINHNPDDKYQGVWFTGLIPGWRLQEFGVRGLDSQADYEGVALSLGNRIVHARLNADPLGNRNYHKAVYKPIKGAFWGTGVPKLMDYTQDACNATARHMLNNLAISSGPQVVVHNQEDMAEGDKTDSLYPWRIWFFNDPSRKGKSPMTFEQPILNVAELMAVFDRFLRLSDDATGIPNFETGAPDNRGAAKTATGLSMLMNSAARVLKKSIGYISNDIIKPCVTQVFNWNMLYLDDPSIKGDVKIEANGAMALFVQEQQQLRLNEYITLTGNPIDLEIIGKSGRAALLRGAGKGLPVDADEIVPTKTELDAQEEAALQAPQPLQPPVVQ